ncbi:hypothetical protein Tco_0974926 [Tanacetum coccineum]|uniref:Uncharacterized protein n=1 Tax=Tanacetum coccineum TaxID=301880 RepID=A0ABQ5ECX3_9ASTR
MKIAERTYYFDMQSVYGEDLGCRMVEPGKNRVLGHGKKSRAKQILELYEGRFEDLDVKIASNDEEPVRVILVPVLASASFSAKL